MSTAHDKYVALQRHRNAAPLALDLRTTALVIVDMQEYFLNPASPFSRACERLVPGVLGHFQERGRGVVEPSLRRLLDFFRAHGLRVVYTTVASELPDGRDLMPIFQQRNAANRAAVGDVAIPPRGDAWARIVAALEPRPGELVVNKTTYGTFSSTGLDHALRSLVITALVVGGDECLRGDHRPGCRRPRIRHRAARRRMCRLLPGDSRGHAALLPGPLRPGADRRRGPGVVEGR